VGWSCLVIGAGRQFYRWNGKSHRKAGHEVQTKPHVTPASCKDTTNLFQLQFNSERGYYWKDVTTRVSDTKVCGGINRKFLGMLAVMKRGE